MTPLMLEASVGEVELAVDETSQADDSREVCADAATEANVARRLVEQVGTAQLRPARERQRKVCIGADGEDRIGIAAVVVVAGEGVAHLGAVQDERRRVAGEGQHQMPVDLQHPFGGDLGVGQDARRVQPDPEGHLLTTMSFGLLLACTWRGRLAEAIAQSDVTLALGQLSGSHQVLSWAHGLRTLVDLRAGALARALDHGERAQLLSEGIEANPFSAVNGGWLAGAEAALGRRDQATSWASAAKATAAGLGLPGRDGAALHAASVAEQDPAMGARLALRASAKLALAHPIEAARARTLAGRCLGAAGNREAALNELRGPAPSSRRSPLRGASGSRTTAPRRAARARRSSPQRVHRHRLTERPRARGRHSRPRPIYQPPNRRSPRAQREDGRASPLSNLRQARRPLSCRCRSRARL